MSMKAKKFIRKVALSLCMVMILGAVATGCGKSTVDKTKPSGEIEKENEIDADKVAQSVISSYFDDIIYPGDTGNDTKWSSSEKKGVTTVTGTVVIPIDGDPKCDVTVVYEPVGTNYVTKSFVVNGVDVVKDNQEIDGGVQAVYESLDASAGTEQ